MIKGLQSKKSPSFFALESLCLYLRKTRQLDVAALTAIGEMFDGRVSRTRFPLQRWFDRPRKRVYRPCLLG